MIIYTIKGLCLRGELEIFSRFILITSSDTKKRRRTFIKRNPDSLKQNISSAEELILGFFEPGEELRLYELRWRIENRLKKKLKDFKEQYVYKDVKEKNFCFLTCFLTSAGRAEKKRCAALIDATEYLAKLSELDDPKLKQNLLDLAGNAIFLDGAAQKKTGLYKPEFNDLDLLFGVGKDNLPPDGSYTNNGMSPYSNGGMGGAW